MTQAIQGLKQSDLTLASFHYRGCVIIMVESRKTHKKVKENRNKGNNSMENHGNYGKEKCPGNRKMTFLSHGKPENGKIDAESGMLF